MKTYCIYELRFEGEPFYVGKSFIDGLSQRKSQHIYNSKKSNTHKSNKIKKILREGKDFEIVPVLISNDEKTCFEMEIKYIKQMRDKGINLCNHTDGGEGLKNPSIKTRKKMAESARKRFSGKGNPSCREDVKRKRSEFFKKNNPMHDKETKRKAIEKIRKSCARSVIKYNKEGEKVNMYSSIRDAAKQNNLHHVSISKCCNGKQKTCGNFVWKFGGDK